METNKIEKVLLEKELKVISDNLSKIGNQIKDVFKKYKSIQGRHSKELHEYIVSHVFKSGENYFAGYTIEPQPNTHPDHMPECIKKIVLDWAVEDFFENYERVSDVVDNIEND